VRLAYLTSQYPATTHTFIRREVVALRELGIAIDTFSIRHPSAEELIAQEDRDAAATTFTILARPTLVFVGANLATFFAMPLRYLKTARLALGHRPPGMRGLLLSVAHFAESVVLAREIRRRGVTHLHNHFANSAATVGLLASRLLGIGWSFTNHGPSETDYPAGYLLPSKIAAAKLVVCVSWFGCSQGMRLVKPAEWGKFQVVRCGLPLHQLPTKQDRNGRPTTIVAVGRLWPDKAHAGLLEAFAELHREFPEVRLRLVGDGPERGRLEALAEALGIAAAAEFAGRLSETETLAEIARADMLALPSFLEGLPIVLMEAMAMGVPVVATRVAGIPELVVDDVTGLLFTPANWQELAACMKRLLNDEALRNRLATAGRSKVEAEFEVQKSARQLAGLFEQLVDEAPKRTSSAERTRVPARPQAEK
jgi:glycosyltransferase involved in cell wall biosynthesis